MLKFQLFRFQVYPPTQGLLLEQPNSPHEILKAVVHSVPSAELRKGITWHIGNIADIDNNGLYFRIGKTTKSTLEVYEHGNFADAQFETAPYTHIILDIPLEICAIAEKPKLAPKTKGIANQLVQLLNESDFNKKHYEAKFAIGEINDPEDFISFLRKAYAIYKFWITFTKPNAFDANEDFYKPMAKLLKEAEGEKGKTELEGVNLNPAGLEDLARTAASTGNDASSLLQLEKGKQKIRKHLKNNAVLILWESIIESYQRKELLSHIRKLYENIRKKE